MEKEILTDSMIVAITKYNLIEHDMCVVITNATKQIKFIYWTLRKNCRKVAM
jgi:hypothetical protein